MLSVDVAQASPVEEGPAVGLLHGHVALSHKAAVGHGSLLPRVTELCQAP